MTTTPPAPSSLNWKDHPVVIAAGSVAAALLFAWNFVVPLKTAELEAKAASDRQRIASLQDDAVRLTAKLQGQIDELTNQKKVVEGRLREVVSRLALYETKDTFAPGDPYPIGISLVRLGADFDMVDKAFPNADKKSVMKGRFTSVDIDHAVFSDITYYRERFNRGRSIVMQILYRLKNTDLRSALDLKMNAAFGSPKEVLDGNKAWNVKGASVVLLKDSVSVSPVGTRPGSWSDD